MNIGICEDNPIHRELLVEHIRAWAVRKCGSTAAISQQMPKIHEYANAESFFFNLDVHGPFDLLFLDIDLSGPDFLDETHGPGKHKPDEGGSNGLEIALRVREMGIKSVIVFVTSHTEHVFRGYKVQAFDYLVKPVAAHEVYRVLEHTKANMSEKDVKSLMIEASDGIKRVPLCDIYYIEAQLHYMELHGTGGAEVFRGRFADVAEELAGHGFTVPHRSFLINMAYVKGMSKTSVTMEDDRVVPMSRHRKTEFLNAWLDYTGSPVRECVG